MNDHIKCITALGYNFFCSTVSRNK